MPLGDSLTYDNTYADDEKPRPSGIRTGYRSHLWYMLKDANYSVDFVGSQRAGEAIKPPFDPDNEGHPGWTSYEIAEKVHGSLVKYQPNIILLHAGTNDRSTTNPEGINQILNEIDYYEETSGNIVRVYVALILDRKEKDGRIRIFNRRLKALIASRITNGDNLVLVDIYGKVKLSSDHYVDPTHPDKYGYWKMAKVWYHALMTPYTGSLHAFPYTLVNSSYIHWVNVNESSQTVQFMADIPDSGIIF
jgi:hypothetical protein